MKPVHILLLGLLALVAGVFLWALWKSKQPGAKGGALSQVGSLLGWAEGTTQEVTEASVKAGATLGAGIYKAGSGLAGGAHGAISIVDDAGHMGGSLNPANWSWP